MNGSIKHKKCVDCNAEWTTADLESPCPACSSNVSAKEKVVPPLAKQVGGTHYKQFKIQPVEFCQVNNIGYCESSCIKYLCRWKDKGGIDDLKKAIHFIEMLVELELKKQ